MSLSLSYLSAALGHGEYHSSVAEKHYLRPCALLFLKVLRTPLCLKTKKFRIFLYLHFNCPNLNRAEDAH